MLDRWQLRSAYDLLFKKLMGYRTCGLFKVLTSGKLYAEILEKVVFKSIHIEMSSFFSKKQRRDRYLFDNFHSTLETNPLSLSFNLDSKKRLSTGQFSMPPGGIWFKLGRSVLWTQTVPKDGKGNNVKADISTFATRLPNRTSQNRVLHITGLRTSLFDVNNLDIHYPLPKLSSTSTVVNADTLEFYIAIALFTRKKNGFIHLHIPVAERIDRLTPKRYLHFIKLVVTPRCLSLILSRDQFMIRRNLPGLIQDRRRARAFSMIHSF
jgi:hypothetical protein